jgi:hypothetical protein
MLDADGCQAEHDARYETHGDADPSDNIRPANVKGSVVTEKLRPSQVKFKTFVVNLKYFQYPSVYLEMKTQ